MQNRLRLDSIVGCEWFMVCWNASCGCNVNRKSLNGDPLWLLCWLRPLDRDGRHAQRLEPATVASSNVLGHNANIKTKHLTIWQGMTCSPGPARWSVDRKLKSIGEQAATSLTARINSAMHIKRVFMVRGRTFPLFTPHDGYRFSYTSLEGRKERKRNYIQCPK